jgi:hypothetical protein
VQNLQVARVGYLRLRSSWFLRQWVRMDEFYTMEWSKLVFGRNHWWWLWNTQRG